MGIEINPSMLRMLSPAEQLVAGGTALREAAGLFSAADDAARLAVAAEHPFNRDALHLLAGQHLEAGTALASVGTEAIGLAGGSPARREMADQMIRRIGLAPSRSELRSIALDNDSITAALRDVLSTGGAPRAHAAIGSELIERIDRLGTRAISLGEMPGSAVSTKRPLGVFMDGPVNVDIGDWRGEGSGLFVRLKGVMPQPADSALLDGTVRLDPQLHYVEHYNIYDKTVPRVGGFAHVGDLEA